MEDTEEISQDLLDYLEMGVLVALVVAAAMEKVPLVEQEILLLQLHKLKDFLVVMLVLVLVLQSLEVVVVVELLKQVLLVRLVVVVAEEVLVQQLLFQQVL